MAMARKDITVANINESEKLLEKKLGRAVRQLGGKSIKIDARYFTGVPDRLIVLPEGRVVFVEVKSTGVKPRKIQLYVHKILRGLGFDVRVIDSTSKIEWLILDYSL